MFGMPIIWFIGYASYLFYFGQLVSWVVVVLRTLKFRAFYMHIRNRKGIGVSVCIGLVILQQIHLHYSHDLIFPWFMYLSVKKLLMYVVSSKNCRNGTSLMLSSHICRSLCPLVVLTNRFLCSRSTAFSFTFICVWKIIIGFIRYRVLLLYFFFFE